VWVADRENSRVQIFDAQGKFLDQLTDLSKPSDIFIDPEETVYISELSPRISIFTIDGKLLSRLDSEEQDKEAEQFISLHGILHDMAVDSRGDIYTGENITLHVGRTVALRKFARVN